MAEIPHPDANNMQRLVDEGYRFLMPTPARSFASPELGRRLSGRG